MANTDTARFEPGVTTAKQRGFQRDFLAAWEDCEFWEEAAIGRRRRLPGEFVVEEEDVLAYNRALGETHPLYVDPEYARAHAPHGSLLVHPVFLTAVGFWLMQPGVQGSWIRTPGARNPFQRIDMHERLSIGERLSMIQENVDRFWRRGKAYITCYGLILNQNEVEKAELWSTLILPPSREDVRRYAEA